MFQLYHDAQQYGGSKLGRPGANPWLGGGRPSTYVHFRTPLKIIYRELLLAVVFFTFKVVYIIILSKQSPTNISDITKSFRKKVT